MRLLTLFLITSSGLAGTLGLTQSGQGQGQKDAPGQQKEKDKEHAVGRSDAGSRSDGILATWLLIDNENEVALARLAQQRAQDPEVKQFAQMMVSDHEQMSQPLQPIAAKVGYTGDSSVAGGAGQDQNRPREASMNREPGELDHVALLQELGQECRMSARQLLESKQGAEFDKCFMDMMVGAHMKMDDMLTVFDRHASGELKSVIDQAQGKVQSHLQKAQDIAKKVGDKSSGQSGR